MKSFFTLIGLLLIWEVYGDVPFILPAPSGILSVLMHHPERFLDHAKATAFEMLGGILLAFSASFPLAWLMWRSHALRSFAEPLIVLIQCIPMFTLAPLMVLWFGFSAMAIILPTALMIFFPLTISITQGFRAVPQSMLDLFETHEATSWQLFAKLQLPSALPHIFSGLRVSAAIAGIGAIAGEWAGAQKGLGVLMLESRRATDLETTFGALLILAFLSLSFYGVIALFEKKISLSKFAPLLLAFTLVSCAEKEQKTTLLLDWFPNPNHVALYAGIQKGYLDIELLRIHDPSDAVPFLASGQADFAISYAAETILSGTEIAGILIDVPLNGIIYRQGEGIENPSDLQGKVIGYCANRDVLERILKQNHIEPAELCNVSFDLVSALGTRQVDALYGAYWNIEVEHLRSLGVDAAYFSLEELGVPSHPELLVLGKASVAFQEALQKSLDFSREFPDEAFELYARANPDKSEKTLVWEKKAWLATYPHLAKAQQGELRLFSSWLK